MKIVNALLAVMFLIFAALQLNDPDPYLWIPIYVAMVVVCIMAMFNSYNRKAMIVLMIVYTLLCIYYVPGVAEWLRQDDKSQLFDNIAKMEHPFIEESREFLGLLINMIVLVIYLIVSRKK
jgi:ribose/xylose/arabinose/galactoside ABC-type transport system permease subunit